MSVCDNRVLCAIGPPALTHQHNHKLSADIGAWRSLTDGDRQGAGQRENMEK